MNRNTVWVIVVIIIVLAGGWFLSSGILVKAPGSETTVTSKKNVAPAVTVTYTDQGFSPKSITVPLGTTVTFVNQSTSGMWVASAKHPSHAVYSGTSLSEHCPDKTGTALDECASVARGGSYSFTFAKAGTWGYHNHVQAADFGTVTVTAASTSI